MSAFEGKADIGGLASSSPKVYFAASEVETMADRVASHYSEDLKLADAIAQKLRSAGKDLNKLTAADLAIVDEFHIRGRKATLELGEKMNLNARSRVLDIGSGLGGPARTLAETYGCHVTGIDLTQAFCDAATAMSDWVGLGDRVSFEQGDATNLPFQNETFDAAMTIHVAMNIAAKDKVYTEACRVLKPGSVFAVYDVLQGEGGDVLYPVPWAREPSISHVATTDEMKTLLTNAGFKVLEVQDSTEESQSFFERMTAQMAKTGASPVMWQLFLGDDFPAMARNQVRNVTERRIRTVTLICTA
jgi:ubiquinone/menaquinone biosynthesis C-methylase UbiE